MCEGHLVSIVINNYNYGRFLGEAIESALNQTYAPTEVIVVDDGSTDNSREVIAGYGDRIVPLLKENGGQASALNAGFVLSRGDIVLFLDSDDALLPSAVKEAVNRFSEDTAKIHWPLWVINSASQRTGQMTPNSTLPVGDFRDRIIRDGPTHLLSSPTSGNAWARRFLQSVLPMPEQVYRTGADTYLYELAPLFGRIGGVPDPQGLYRTHGQNDHLRMGFAERLAHELQWFEGYLPVLVERCRQMGFDVDLDVWKANSWWHRQRQAAQEIAALIPPEEPFLLLDEATWGMEVNACCRPVPFPERDGEYAGLPQDDEAAIEELERQRQAGVRIVVFAWPAFWWLQYYTGLRERLCSQFRCVLSDERLMIFDARPCEERTALRSLEEA